MVMENTQDQDQDIEELTEEEVYDIFRNIFHNEEDALAATRLLFNGNGQEWFEDVLDG